MGAIHRVRLRKRCRIPVAISKAKALLHSGFQKIKIQVTLERHDIPRVLETPFIFF